ICDIDFMNLNTIDLNLLKVFDAVLSEGTVTRAADRLGLTQPAVSNAISRLRAHVGDDLFVRSASGMKPTRRAEELSGPIRQSLSMLEDALENADFDPATSKRTFRIVAVDLGASGLLPRLAGYLSEHAPHVNIRMHQARGDSAAMLDRQKVDFALLPLGGLPAHLQRMELEPIKFVILMRDGHPLAEAPLTLEAFTSFPHTTVSLTGDDRSFVDEILARRGFTRRVAMTITNFAMGPAIVAASDLLITVPQRIAEIYAPKLNLIVREPPFHQPKDMFQSVMAWHPQFAASPAHDWFRRVVWDIGGV
ncbi:MAG: LysR family transcriptional regulator, partial [Pseudomonadota bacterium]